VTGNITWEIKLSRRKEKNNKQRQIIDSGNNIFRAAFLKLTLGFREIRWGKKKLQIYYH